MMQAIQLSYLRALMTLPNLRSLTFINCDIMSVQGMEGLQSRWLRSPAVEEAQVRHPLEMILFSKTCASVGKLLKYSD
jgi:hypothetical protein